MMEDDVFYLVPKSHMEAIHQSKQSGGSITPISVTTGTEAPVHSQLYRNVRLNDTAEGSLEGDKSPEIMLKLYNYLHGLYRTSIDKESSKESNVEEKQEPKAAKDIDYAIFTASLPNVAQKLAPSFLNYLKNNTALVFNPNGFVKHPNIADTVHIIDLLRTVLVNKTRITQTLNEIIQTFLPALPTSFLKNKSLKIENQGDEEDYWDSFQ